MAKIKVNETIYEASISVQGHMMTMTMESELTLEELTAQFDAAAAPEILVLAEDGTTEKIYKNHAVLRLVICPGDKRKVSVTIRAEPLAQSEADRLQEQINLQAKTIAAQADKIAAQDNLIAQQSKTIQSQSALLEAASVAARRTVAADYDAMSDEELAKCTSLFDDWAAGKPVAVGDMLAYNGRLYVVIQAHTTQTGWEPEVVPALFRYKGETQED